MDVADVQAYDLAGNAAALLCIQQVPLDPTVQLSA